MSTYASILTEDALTIYVNGQARVAHRDSKNFDKVLEAYKAKDFNLAIELMDKVGKEINAFGEGIITVENGAVLFNGHAIHNVLTDRILKMMEEGFDISPMVNFLENLLQNPSKTAVQELYLFLEHGKLPITEDGHFLAYKRVRGDFKDIHSGKFDNSPGQQPTMLRCEVDDNRENTCSTGLHFCSIEYLPNFGGTSGNKVVIVKINPRDVVSIPSDYNNTKGRASTYLVLEEYTGPLDNSIFEDSVWTSSDDEDESDSWDEGDDSWEDDSNDDVFGGEEDGTHLDGGSLALKDEAGNTVATLEMQAVPNVPKPVMPELIGQIREDNEGTRYKIIATERKRNHRGHFTGAILIHWESTDAEGNTTADVTEWDIVKNYSKVVQEAPTTTDTTVVKRVGQHIDPKLIAGTDFTA